MSILIKPIDNIAVVKNAQNTLVNLFTKFDDALTTGLVAHFNLYDSSLGGGVTNVVLFDQKTEGAPLTVQNFLNYVEGGDYENSIIHRSIPGFVIQGGGFTIDGWEQGNKLQAIPTDPPVVNEFSPERSNLRGTIAMAKGNNPDSATSQWFFNLGNNSANLDNQNGGFTVFGQVLSPEDMAAVDAIANLPISHFNPPFDDLPLIGVDDPANPVITGDDNFVRYSQITISQETELTFTVVNNSNPGLVNATIQNNQLLLDYATGGSGTAEILVRATNLLGEFVEDSFSVSVQDSRQIVGTAGDDILVGAGGNDTLIGGLGNDSLSGGNGRNLLQGDKGRDFLVGGGKNDTLIGGGGEDKLSGKGGADRFVFDSRFEGVDLITDFKPGKDLIQVRRSGFRGGLTVVSLDANQFVLGSSASDSSDRFIYNQGDGGLYFDRDGNGSLGQVQIAVLRNKASLSFSDIQVI